MQPRLLKVAFNYQLVTKEAGFYGHNLSHATRLPIGSFADIGADANAYAKPSCEVQLLVGANAAGQGETWYCPLFFCPSRL